MNTELTRDYRKVFTHPKTAYLMAKLLNPMPGQAILEPSAGSGNLVRAVKKREPNAWIAAVEIQEKWRDYLKQCAEVVYIKDFLTMPCSPKFSACIANPPFGNGTDLNAHIQHMIDSVKSGGRLVILVPKEYEPPCVHKSIALANWATNKDGTVTPIKIIVFNKP